MLALGTATLLENRELWNRLIADPTSAGPIVDELLRLLSVVQVAFPRFVKRDVVIGGQPDLRRLRRPRLAAGSQPRPARDRRRRPRHHRVPRAPTSPSATASTAASAPSWPGWSCGWPSRRWRARFPDMRLAVPSEDLDYRALSIVYGVESVPVVVS